MTIFDEIAKAGEEEQAKQAIDLALIGRLATTQANLEAPANEEKVESIWAKIINMNPSVKDLEAVLKKLKKIYFNVRQVQIPQYMEEFGLSSVTTENGDTIEIKGDVSCTIRDNINFFNYMRKEEMGELIKDVITVNVKNGSQAKEVISTLEDTESLFERKQSIHPQTLKKFVRGQLAKGAALPESINVYEYKYSKLKRRK